MNFHFLRDIRRSDLGFSESICLYSFLTSITGVSIDIILPAYQDIGRSFDVFEAEDLQKNILLFIAGMFIGELFSGYIADIVGRKKAFGLSVLTYFVGTFLCLVSNSFGLLLLGRFIQGIGAAGQKISIRATIRDRFTGHELARLASFTMAVFMFVPFLAPMIGEQLSGLGWRWIFVFLHAFSLVAAAWFLIRHRETLVAANRNFAGVSAVGPVFISFISNIKAMGYTTIAGLLFGIHLAFISLSSVMFLDMYGIEKQFPYYFGSIACAFGLALLLNGKVVMKYGINFMTLLGLVLMILTGIFSLLISLNESRAPDLELFLGIMFLLLFSVGIVFGNIGALTMEPLGKVAGLGTALSASISSLIAVVISFLVGIYYDGGLLSFAVAILVCSLASFFICILAQKSPIVVISYWSGNDSLKPG